MSRNQDNSEDDDIEAILDQMDNMNSADLRDFENNLRKLCREDDSSMYDTDDGDSTFSNLSLDFHRRPLESRNNANEPFRLDSPIRSKINRNHRNPSRAVDYRITAFALDKNEEQLRAYDPEGHDLLNQATRKLCELYQTMDKCDAIEKQFFPESHSTFDVTDELFLEEQENEPYEDDEHHHARRENIKPPEFETDKERKKDVALDKRLRKVHAPETGRAPYRHDPVNTYHMYQEEWKRRPTPEEQKRLSLRWKVRDYMMSRKFDPKLQPTGEPVQHDKDWSPRAYLD